MRVALFIPCYIDQFYPDVGMATVEILERIGLNPEFPEAQTCCGQPMANTGCDDQARPLAEKFFQVFRGYDAIVCPSGSCTSMVRNHYGPYLKDRGDAFTELTRKTFELCEFLTDVMDVKPSTFTGSFPYRVGIHKSCHGLRELRLGQCSERVAPAFDKVGTLLTNLEGIELTELDRADECCGFGGTFAVNEEAISCMMGRDRLRDHEQAGTQVLTGGDSSCLMHMAGLARREKRPLAFMHIAEILAGRQPVFPETVAAS